jgi:ribosomal-protein-alanine N-acetyltransferase
MPELQRLEAGHAPAVLAFERANRAWFAASISDRGDEFFTEFADRFRALLADQEAGRAAYHDLIFTGDGVATLGYRVAQQAAGRGVATATVRELCQRATASYGLRTVRAATADANAASRKVLARSGFVPAGPADPAEIGGKQGTWYQLDLADCPHG